MSFPASPPFNPQVSKVPILGASSGNPASFRDPKSVASIGLSIQALADQAKADTLYDPPPPKPEGFVTGVFIRSNKKPRKSAHKWSNSDKAALGLIIVGSILIMRSYYMKR